MHIKICPEWDVKRNRCVACDECPSWGCDICMKGCADSHEGEELRCPAYPDIWGDKNERYEDD